VGGKNAAVVADVHGLAVEEVDSAADPPLAVAVKPDGLSDLYERDGSARLGEGAALAVGGGVGLHGGSGGRHGAVVGGDGGFKVVVGADKEAGGFPGDGSGGRGSVGARGVVAGLVGHSDGEVRGEFGGLGGDADVGFADGAMVSFVAANAPTGLGGNGSPVDAHGVEGIYKGVVLGFVAAVGQYGVGAAPYGQPGEVEQGENVGAVHGGDDAALAKVCLQAGDVEHLGQVGAELEGIEGDVAVQHERARGEGVAWAPGEVGELLAGDTGAGDFAEGGDVGGHESGRREGSEEGVDAGVAELAVSQGELRAGVVGGRGGRGRGGGGGEGGGGGGGGGEVAALYRA